jgi:hypothetical protein
MKEEILIADKSPDYEQEIQSARDKTGSNITGRAAIALVCRNFEPPKDFSFWPWWGDAVLIAQFHDCLATNALSFALCVNLIDQKAAAVE